VVLGRRVDTRSADPAAGAWFPAVKERDVSRVALLAELDPYTMGFRGRARLLDDARHRVAAHAIGSRSSGSANNVPRMQRTRARLRCSYSSRSSIDRSKPLTRPQLQPGFGAPVAAGQQGPERSVPRHWPGHRHADAAVPARLRPSLRPPGWASALGHCHRPATAGMTCDPRPRTNPTGSSPYGMTWTSSTPGSAYRAI
jgi:hypothetical protein